MDKTKQKHTYLFLDPNSAEELAGFLRQLLLERLRSVAAEED